MKRFDSQLFASRLTMKQREFRMTVTEAAKEIGISKSTLSRLNREVGLPDVDSYYRCCKWLNYEMTFFFR